MLGTRAERTREATSPQKCCAFTQLRTCTSIIVNAQQSSHQRLMRVATGQRTAAMLETILLFYLGFHELQLVGVNQDCLKGKNTDSLT